MALSHMTLGDLESSKSKSVRFRNLIFRFILHERRWRWVFLHRRRRPWWIRTRTFSSEEKYPRKISNAVKHTKLATLETIFQHLRFYNARYAYSKHSAIVYVFQTTFLSDHGRLCYPTFRENYTTIPENIILSHKKSEGVSYDVAGKLYVSQKSTDLLIFLRHFQKTRTPVK